jgi:predicted nuclease with TOPRIM domain
MKAASINEIKKELIELDSKAVQDLCMRLAKYKKENKELLTYLLFEAHDEAAFVNNVKTEMDELFQSLPSGNVYYIKKSLRKILRIVNKQIKYSGLKQTELELRLYFCVKIKECNVPLRSSTVLYNLNEGQVKKIKTVLTHLPEDLQFDYHREIVSLDT